MGQADETDNDASATKSSMMCSYHCDLCKDNELESDFVRDQKPEEACVSNSKFDLRMSYRKVRAQVGPMCTMVYDKEPVTFNACS